LTVKDLTQISSGDCISLSQESAFNIVPSASLCLFLYVIPAYNPCTISLSRLSLLIGSSRHYTAGLPLHPVVQSLEGSPYDLSRKILILRRFGDLCHIKLMSFRYKLKVRKDYSDCCKMIILDNINELNSFEVKGINEKYASVKGIKFAYNYYEQ
jgi:hypothetical protein